MVPSESNWKARYSIRQKSPRRMLLPGAYWPSRTPLTTPWLYRKSTAATVAAPWPERSLKYLEMVDGSTAICTSPV